MLRWAELVFHVLAHVRVGVAASVFDPPWIAFVERSVGPRSARPLGEDSEILARLAPGHDALAELQLLAWLFDDVERARSCGERTLAELTEGDVEEPAVLRHLQRAPLVTAAEVLRAAAELEEPHYRALPEPTRDPALSRELARVRDLAPWLDRYRVAEVRPLRLRGRVRGAEILVGVACLDLGPTAEHVAYQAAHEASVAELQRSAREVGVPIAHDALEHAALVLLAERARAHGESSAHARWLSHFAAVPELDRRALEAPWRPLVERYSAAPSSGRGARERSRT